jgi:hypothetical protein
MSVDSDNGTPVGKVDKSKQLLREVFAPMRNGNRDRPLYGYNFSPPSTPNGNHLIVDRESKRKKLEEDIAAIVEQQDEGLDEFTPRCLLQRTIMEQKLLVRSVTDMTTADWNLMASCLSPPSCKRPLHPCTGMTRGTPHTHIVIPCDTCLCIACAGMKAKPIVTPCIVCGASISYSVCLKAGVHSPVPKMCFACCTFCHANS